MYLYVFSKFSILFRNYDTNIQADKISNILFSFRPLFLITVKLGLLEKFSELN